MRKMTQDRSADFSGGLRPRDFSPNAGTPPSLLITSWSRHAAKSAWFALSPALLGILTFLSVVYAVKCTRRARSPRCLIRKVQVILPIREKSRKTDPVRVHRGSIYNRGFRWTGRGKYVPNRQATEIESLGTLYPAK